MLLTVTWVMRLEIASLDRRDLGNGECWAESSKDARNAHLAGEIGDGSRWTIWMIPILGSATESALLFESRQDHEVLFPSSTK